MRTGLAATKLQLVREAVHHNVAARRPRARAALPGRTPMLPLLIAAVCLIGSLIYVSVPSGPSVPVAAAAGPPVRMPAGVPHRLARGVLPLAVNRIALDAGHGGSHTGAVSASGVMEKNVTLEIARRLERLLAKASFDVRMTRRTDATLSLEERVAIANANRADLFVSIHINWIPRREVRPLETYYAGPSDDPHVLSLARAENRESGYPLAAYRQLLEKVYLDTRRDESSTLARAVNGELYRSLSPINPRLDNRGVKTAPFAVLLGTEMPAILVELSCLSNEEEVQLITNADYQETIAAALLRAVRAYARDLNGSGRREG